MASFHSPAQVPDAELLDHAQHEAPYDRAVEVPYAADDGRYPALQQEQQAHPWLEGGIVAAQDSGKRGEHRPDEEHYGDDERGIDPDYLRDLLIVADSPHRLSEVRSS